MRRLLTLSVLVATAAGCASHGSIASVDPLRKKVEFQSTSDNRSAMPDLKGDAAVRKAIEQLRGDLEKKPNSVETLLNLAQLHLMLNQFKPAEDYTRRALRADLKNEEARKIMAQIYFRKGNNEMASIILNGLGGIRSKDSKVLNLLGMIAIRETRNTEAMDYFKQALKVNPNDVAVRMNLGVLYVRYRQLANASVEFERVLKIMPDHNDAKLHLAIIKTSRGDYKQAETIYADILDKRRGNPLALYNLAVLERNRKNYNNAVEVLKKYLGTAQAKKKKNSEVFSLIEDIRKAQAASGPAVSDDEIQALAEKEMSEPDIKPAAAEEAPAVAAPSSARKSSSGREEEISELEQLLK